MLWYRLRARGMEARERSGDLIYAIQVDEAGTMRVYAYGRLAEPEPERGLLDQRGVEEGEGTAGL